MKKNYMRLIVALLFATNLMAQNVPNYVPTNGLIGWWPFNGNANDESGNGNNGTVNGATLTSDRNGKTNSAFYFNKIQNITCGKSNVFGLTDNYLSFSFWTQSNNNALPYIAKYQNMVPSNSNYFIGNAGKTTTNKFKITANGQNSYDFNITSSNWNHIFVFFDGKKDSVTIYLNNELISKNSLIFSNIISNQELAFGSIPSFDYNPNNASYAYPMVNGILDDIAIFNRALTKEEIKQLYEGCTKETATSTSFNSYVFTNNTPINLSATPIGGTFSGDGILNNAFNPTKALLGKNAIKYNFKNTSGCADSTDFSMIMVDTLGNVCKKTINDTVSILKIHFQLTTGIKANTVTNISVYPNPTSDVLIIDANDSQALAGYTYRILDVQGKEIYNAPVTSSKTEIALKTLGAKGVYVLHIVDANGISIENKKIVLQ